MLKEEQIIGIILHKKSLITISGHKQKKKDHNKFDIFDKKKYFNDLWILVFICNQIINFEVKIT